MTLNLSAPGDGQELKPRITVVGVGGAGTNAVNNMIKLSLEGAEFVVANTDAQSLGQSQCERRIQLGTNITHGLGAGARPDIGRAAAEEAMEAIADNIDGSNMVFIAAGLGGATGTGAGPVIARVARERGILTVGVVTKPFHFEGQHRMRTADDGLAELQKFVDTLIVIPNQNLFRVANEKTTFADAFNMADEVLYDGVRGVTDLIVRPGLINLDFADIRTVMAEMGKAMMGTGEASGEKRAVEAAEKAIANPLLEDVSMKGARSLLMNVTGGLDMTLFEVDAAANRVRDEIDPDANIIFGSTFDESMEGIMRCSIVATGIDADEMAMPRPAHLYPVAPAVPASPAAAAGPAADPAADGLAAAGPADADALPAALPPLAVDGNAAAAVEPAVAARVAQPAIARALDGPAPDARAPFIAPPPVEPAAGAREPRISDPFAAAEMANAEMAGTGMAGTDMAGAEMATAGSAGADAGSGEDGRARGGRSLFQKVTGAALGRRESADATAIRAEPDIAAPVAAAAAPAAAAAVTAPAAAAAVAEPAAAASEATPRVVAHATVGGAATAMSGGAATAPATVESRQASLDGVAPPPLPAATDTSDDLLAIPAFLRRQAN